MPESRPRKTNLTGRSGVTLVDLVQITHGLENAGTFSLKSLVIHLRKPLSLGRSGSFPREFGWVIYQSSHQLSHLSR